MKTKLRHYDYIETSDLYIENNFNILIQIFLLKTRILIEF